MGYSWTVSVLNSVLVLSIVSLGLLEGIDGRIVTLGRDSDQDSGFWSEISCTYKGDFAAYNRTCPRNVHPDERAFRGREGFWSPCGSAKCELIYYGGSMPQPKSIKVTGMVAGSGRILVQGRRSAIGQSYDFNVTSLDVKTANLSFATVTADQQTDFNQSFAFRFVLVSQDMKSIAVLDKIEIDLGDEIPDLPTTTAGPTEPTSPPPTDFFLDTREDQSSVDWSEVTCNYADLAEDLWVWGCQQDFEEAVGDGNSTGYWAPCVSHACSFIFKANDVAQHPSDVTLTGSLGKGSRVVLSRKLKGLNHNDVSIVSVDVSDDTDSWTYRLPFYYPEDLYNITVVSINGSTVLIDSVNIHISSDLSRESTTEGGQTTSTTIPPSGGTATTTTVKSTTAGADHAISSYVTATVTVFAAVLTFASLQV